MQADGRAHEGGELGVLAQVLIAERLLDQQQPGLVRVCEMISLALPDLVFGLDALGWWSRVRDGCGGGENGRRADGGSRTATTIHSPCAGT